MSDNHGSWLGTACALFFSWSTLTFIVRVWVKLSSRSWGLDDFSFAAGFVTVGMHVATTFWALHYNYGRPLTSISESKVFQVEKSLYASQHFYIVSIGLSKISTALFIGRLTHQGLQLRAAYSLAVVSGVWTLASMLLVGLRGNLSRPWAILDGSQSLYVRWIVVEALGLALELALCALSTSLVWGLKMALRKRLFILSAFGCRMLLIPIVAVRLFYLSPVQNSDPTFTSIIPNILTEAALQFSFISASVTSLRPFFRPFHDQGYMFNTTGPGSGILSGSHSRSQETYYKLNATQRADKSGAGSKIRSVPPPLLDPNAQQSVISTRSKRHSIRAHQDDQASVDSAGSDQMIIRKTMDWSIQYDADRPTPQHESAHARYSSQNQVSAQSHAS